MWYKKSCAVLLSLESDYQLNASFNRTAILIVLIVGLCLCFTGCSTGKEAAKREDAKQGISSMDKVERPKVDAVLIPESAWHGVDVYDNKNPHSDPTNYTYGQKWQCVELVQRFYATKWEYKPIWPVQYAYQMYNAAPAGVIRHPNGDTSSAPVWGDVLVFAPNKSGQPGHVAIITGVKDGKVYTVQQNAKTATESIAFDPVTHRFGTHEGLQAIGWLHSPRNNGGPNIIW